MRARGGWTHSLTRRAGRVGTNLSFCVPRRVTSLCFFARLAMAFGGLLPEPEPDAPALPDGCSDIGVEEVRKQDVCSPGGVGARSRFKHSYSGASRYLFQSNRIDNRS